VRKEEAVTQTPEKRMYKYWQSLRRDREYGHAHYSKGYLPGKYMMVARKFKRPIREVKEIIELQKGGQ
jgi:hypothetical protein